MRKFGRQMLALAIVAALIFSLGIAAFAAEYKDMPSSGSWAYKPLNAAVDNNLLKGDDNNQLNPEANLSRAELATIINRAFGANQAANMGSFSDVPKDAWYYGEIAKSINMGVLTGDGAGIIRPQSPITRQEAFTVLARALKLTMSDYSVLDKFSDKESVANWAKGYIAAMVSAGYVDGLNGTLNPTGTITRQEFAQVMYNAISSYVSKAGTITTVQAGNVMVNVPGVTLKDLTVNGDLIVGDGVGNGNFTLDNVTVKGRMIVRGGGSNSIIIINKSSVGNIVISKDSDGAVHINTDSSSSVETIYVADGKDGVIVEGNVTNLTVAGTTSVEIKGTVSNMTVTKDAAKAAITVDSGSTVSTLQVSASNVTVGGAGKITEATVSGNNTAINVVGTKVTVSSGTTGTTANGNTVTGGTTVTVQKPTTTGGGNVSSTVSVSSVKLTLSNSNIPLTGTSVTGGYTFDLSSTSAYPDATTITSIEIDTSSATTYSVSDYSISTNIKVPISTFLDMLGLDDTSTVSLGKIRTLGNSFSVSGTITGGSSLDVTFNVGSSGYYSLTNNGTTVTAQLIKDASISAADGISGLNFDPVALLVANITDKTNQQVVYSVTYKQSGLSVTRTYTGYDSISSFTLKGLIGLVNNNGGRTIAKLSELTNSTVTITYGTKTLTLEFK